MTMARNLRTMYIEDILNIISNQSCLNKVGVIIKPRLTTWLCLTETLNKPATATFNNVALFIAN
jgi:hypothetical protein